MRDFLSLFAALFAINLAAAIIMSACLAVICWGVAGILRNEASKCAGAGQRPACQQNIHPATP